jgi:hypothetical protein
VLDTDAGACRSAPNSRPTQSLSTQSHPRRVREHRGQSWGHATRRVFVRCGRREDGRRAEDPPATGAGAAVRGLGFSRPTIGAMRINRRCPPYAEPGRDRCRETPHRACFAYNGLCDCRSMAVGRVGAEVPNRQINRRSKAVDQFKVPRPKRTRVKFPFYSHFCVYKAMTTRAAQPQTNFIRDYDAQNFFFSGRRTCSCASGYCSIGRLGSMYDTIFRSLAVELIGLFQGVDRDGLDLRYE